MEPPNLATVDPLAERMVADGAPSARPFSEAPGILVVDDEHMVRIMVQLGLERSGFEVWVAHDGREAIELYREHATHIRVVLLDVRMPGLDGPGTLDALRKLNPDILACFMSGDLGDYEPEDLIRRGAAHIIAKPFRLNELANLLWPLAQGVGAEHLSASPACRDAE
jgi:CheY-like chemotaxis protein